MKFRYVSIEKLKYRNDGLSYALILLGLAINVVYFILLYQNNNNFFYSLNVGFSIIYNLLFMLFIFLCAENIKKYNCKYAYLSFAFGLMQIVRIFNYPKQALNAGGLEQSQYVVITFVLIASAIVLIAGSITSIIKSTILRRFVEGKLEFTDDNE